MTNQHEKTWRMMKDLDYLFDAIVQTQDKLEIMRDCADEMATSLKEFMDEKDYDYSEALDRVLEIGKGDSKQSIVDVFGVTPGEVEREKERRLAHFERRQHIQKIENKPIIAGMDDWVSS